MSTAVYINHSSWDYLGKNQDVPYDGAYFFTNPKGLMKSAMIMPPDLPMEWVSKYGSLTVSQIGKELPHGGMNEAGLVVEQTTLWPSTYPQDQNKPAIGELQWIQLMLDTCASVEEVIDTAASVRIVNPTSRLHYMVCDRTGRNAIVEFMQETPTIYQGETLSVPVMTNTSYPAAVQYLDNGDGQWLMDLDQYDRDSMERFIRAAAYLEKPSAEIGFALDLLKAAAREDTAFSLIYDMKNLEVHYTSKRHPDLKKTSLQEMDFSSASPIVINLQQSGECLPEPYSPALNRSIVESFFRSPELTAAFGWNITDNMISYIAFTPDTYEFTE
ncbi:hypothetical protein DNH61_24410 [Paenibacillus sambharensis]|uniref:Choloylglycine hydrolase/NAAA C-terminal domain-containing protein n=1 Tax=Paenibacillus sambharensis TaxID=1803190 RepID=A0A2W1LN19_9BACL|nr:linear amide C-N hydrolase [Paenibacillus sambharensis]PZD93191.1 hypothetical protein DNH61_24410 [Paenibacillus sambharensis]